VERRQTNRKDKRLFVISCSKSFKK